MTHDDDDDHEPTLYIIPAGLLDAVRGQLLLGGSRDLVQYPETSKLWHQLTHAEAIAGSQFENTYLCDACGASWTDIWMSDDVENECESCGNRHLNPISSVELELIEYHRRPLVEADEP